MINNVVIISGGQQRDSVVYNIHISILSQILSPCRLLPSIEQSFLLYNSRSLLAGSSLKRFGHKERGELNAYCNQILQEVLLVVL